MYCVVDSNGRTILHDNIPSRSEAKKLRGPNDFVTRSRRHPLGVAKLRGLQVKYYSDGMSTKKGRPVGSTDNAKSRTTFKQGDRVQ